MLGEKGRSPRCLSLCLTVCALEIQKKTLLPPHPESCRHDEQGKLSPEHKTPGDNVAKFLRCNPPKKGSLNSWHLLLQRWQSLGITVGWGGGDMVRCRCKKLQKTAFDTSLVMHFATSLSVHAGADG